MKINSIQIVDFRGIERRTFNFNSSFNVLIGENGTGKTSVLEALAAAINPYVSISQGRNVRPIRKEDVRVESFGHHTEKKTKTTLLVNGEIDGKLLEWEIKKSRINWGFMEGDFNAIRDIAKTHFNDISETGGKNVILPVFDYLGCGRLFSEPSKSLKTLPKGSRYEGYYNCLDSTSSIKRFASWFKTMEFSLLQGNETALWRAQVIKRAVKSCLEEWDTLFFGIEEDQLMVLKSGAKSEILPFSYLSDGQRNIVGIVADIAYRCVLLNPYLEMEATKLSHGIVLIDELDLHLHPNWQKSIVKKLKDTFPNIQFITTTHSPFIVQSLKKEELISLQENLIIETDPFRKSIEDGASDYMMVENVERSILFKEMESLAEEYYNLIETKGDKNKISQLEIKLNELEEKYGDDPAYVALLKAERKSK